jgi:hypothetical protein
VTRAAADEVALLWAEHVASAFPDDLRWLDAPSGESVAALDVYMAGCITVYLSAGTLAPESLTALRDCAEQLGRTPQLSEGADYAGRLLRMALLIDAIVAGQA